MTRQGTGRTCIDHSGTERLVASTFVVIERCPDILQPKCAMMYVLYIEEKLIKFKRCFLVLSLWLPFVFVQSNAEISELLRLSLLHKVKLELQDTSMSEMKKKYKLSSFGMIFNLPSHRNKKTIKMYRFVVPVVNEVEKLAVNNEQDINKRQQMM